jgi:hypothetical protein
VIADLIEGVFAFLYATLSLFMVMELSLLLEEFLAYRAESRRGFWATGSHLYKIYYRHILQLFRREEGLGATLAGAFRWVFAMVMVGLMPTWFGQPGIECAHSIWVFFIIGIATPVLGLIWQWAFDRGSSWPFTLASSERAIASSSVLFILGLTLVGMTGVDSFGDLRRIQEEQGWLIFQYPFAIVLMVSFMVMSLYLSFETVFSRPLEMAQTRGWTYDHLSGNLIRMVWSLFVVNVFLGGASGDGFGGALGLVAKWVVVNVTTILLSRPFFRFREDQAEVFVLWRLVPISMVVLVLSILVRRVQ